MHGVVYGIFIGLLAVAGRRTGVLGRAGSVTGAVSALCGLLSPLYFRWETAGWLIPAGRFSGYVVSGIAGVRMARGLR